MTGAPTGSRSIGYQHTQRAPLPWLLGVPGMACLLATFLPGLPAGAELPLLICAALLLLAGLCFGTLTVSDEGDALRLRYGPLPLFGKRIAYDDITAVRPDRSRLIDGWGVHYVPGRGWTYNLWGRDAVLLTLGRRTIRVGSDDAAALCAFLERRIAAERPLD